MTSRLTDKQKGVCELLILGFSNREIGEKLGISHRTVECHREEIFQRLGVRNAVELVRYLLVNEGAKQHG